MEHGGIGDLYLLIRVSQVRDLHGLLASEGRPCRGDLEKIRVSEHQVNRHPDYILVHPEFQSISSTARDPPIPKLLNNQDFSDSHNTKYFFIELLQKFQLRVTSYYSLPDILPDSA
jgi:hypothetical protein